MNNNLLRNISRTLINIGYDNRSLYNDYVFSDLEDPSFIERTVPLAAFAQYPPSYRNACIGFIFTNGQSGVSNVIGYRTLGAPLIFEIGSKYITRWKISEAGPPIFLEKISIATFTRVVEDNAEIWNPEAIFRAKSIPTTLPTIQLDFIDAGLMPILEGMIQQKLKQLIVDILISTNNIYKSKNRNKSPDFRNLFRLLFRLIAAKVLRDRKQPGDWLNDDPKLVIHAIEDYYGRDISISLDPQILNRDILSYVWFTLTNSFNFQNIAVDDLAFIYENTLITKENRKIYGIHSTPPRIAEYIVSKLPFESLLHTGRKVLEPFAGHGIFLISSMRRLRELPISTQNSHRYLVNRLVGIELDSFAREVCRLSLMLADYPNPNGWNIYNENVFSEKTLERELTNSDIVLCNPPFEDFNTEERRLYKSKIQKVQKPAEILRRVLTNPPKLLGFVLPQVFINGSSYNDIRKNIMKNYSNIELVKLPDKVFMHSDMETVLLIASGKNTKNAKAQVLCRTVTDSNRNKFMKNGYEPQPFSRNFKIPDDINKTSDIWVSSLEKLLDYLKGYPLLKDICKMHRGIEWNIRTKLPKYREDRNYVISNKPGKNLYDGLDIVKGRLQQYYINNINYLRIEENLMRTNAYKLPWDKPKVIASASRISRGPWRISACVDSSGLLTTQAFHSIWPNNSIDVYIITALLNSPLTNAYLFSKEKQRSNNITTLNTVPIPPIEVLINSKISYYSSQLSKIIDSAKENNFLEFDEKLAIDCLFRLDSEILKAYDLPPILEKELLNLFQGIQRPVPFGFSGYYPQEFNSNIPLSLYLSKEFKESQVSETLKRLEAATIDDKNITEMLSWLEENI